MQLFLIPVKHDKNGYKHYLNTLQNGFKLSYIKNFVDSNTYQKLCYQYGHRRIYVWGSLPGKRNKATWNQMKIGDKVLIYRYKRYEYSANAIFKLISSKLAERLWSKTLDGQTWKYIYFLDDLKNISSPYNVVNDLFGYKTDYSPHGFTRVNYKTVQSIIRKYGSIDNALNNLSHFN